MVEHYNTRNDIDSRNMQIFACWVKKWDEDYFLRFMIDRNRIDRSIVHEFANLRRYKRVSFVRHWRF